LIRSQYPPPPIEAANAPGSSLISLELVFASHAAYRVYDEFDAACQRKAGNTKN